MNITNDVWIGKKGFRYWYYLYRDSKYYSYSLIGITFIVSFVLIFYVIIPELTNWFSIRDEIAATQQRISVLQQNISFINNLDKAVLNSQLQTATDALPSDKNFGSMLQALSKASADSGVSLNDFSFQVGNLSSSTNHTHVIVPQNNGLSNILITVVANGNINSIKNFIKDLGNNLPLSEVTNIDGNGGNVSVSIQFFEKPFPNISFSGDTPLTPLSSSKVTLLQSLSKIDTAANGNQNAATVVSSGSAVPLF
ncbi:MAG TPA: hypothetical protein VND99_01385 [Candidatus Acidoferrales bacterium]|nr:hypothetical protein [Candidatus Acidoferrales bacterium]